MPVWRMEERQIVVEFEEEGLHEKEKKRREWGVGKWKRVNGGVLSRWIQTSAAGWLRVVRKRESNGPDLCEKEKTAVQRERERQGLGVCPVCVCVSPGTCDLQQQQQQHRRQEQRHDQKKKDQRN